MKLKRFFLVTVLLTTACGTGGGTMNLQLDATASQQIQDGGSGSGTGTGSQGKSLFSLWTESSGFLKVDLSTFQFSTQKLATLTMITGQTCSCQLTIQGTQASGTMNFSTCTGTYPNCSTFNSTSTSATYSKSNTDLQICLTSTSCTNMK